MFSLQTDPKEDSEGELDLENDNGADMDDEDSHNNTHNEQTMKVLFGKAEQLAQSDNQVSDMNTLGITH